MSTTAEGRQAELLHGVRAEIAALRRELANKADLHTVDDLDDRVGRLDHTVRTLEEEASAHEEAVEELRGDLRNEIEAVRSRYDRAVSTIGRRLDWLERHARATTEESTALVVDAALAKLAAATAKGHRLHDTLLADLVRNRHETVVRVAADRRRQIVEQRRTAFEASRTIASTVPGDPAHVAAATAFRTARNAFTNLEKRERAEQDSVDQSRLTLGEDERRRTAHAAAIEAGKRAERQLAVQLRTRLTEAVQRSELLPVWFAAAMGMSPPPDADAWLTTGVDLIVYRATYGVTDPVAALSTAPTTTSPALRRSGYASLKERIARYGDFALR